MSGNEKPQPLAELERLTLAMLEQARCAAWEQVAELEQQRSMLLDISIPQAITDQDNLLLQERLNRIIALDRQVLELARSTQEALGDRLGEINQGRKANRAYQRHAATE